MEKKVSVKKIGDAVHRGADVVRSGREKLQEVHVPISANFPRKKEEWKDGVAWMAKKILETGKISGVTLLWLTEYFIRVMDAIVVDNKFLRGLEKIVAENAKKSEKKIDKKTGRKHGETPMSKFAKNNPWVWAYLTYYASLVGLVAGGAVAADGLINNKDNDEKKDNKEVIKDDAGDDYKPGKDDEKFQDLKRELKTINSADADFVEKAFEEYFPYVAVGITELETYREKPKVHSGERRATNGWGVTWFYSYDSNGNLLQKPNSPGNTRTLTKEENFQQMQMHLKKETFIALKKAIGGKTNINVYQQIALIFAGYQRPSDMKEIAEKLSVATNKQQAADAFTYYAGAQKWKNGTLKRRWWCAAYATGMISSKDLLDLPRDAFSRINLNNVYRNNHFLLTPEVVEYALGKAKEGSKSSVREFLSDFDGGIQVLKSVGADNVFALQQDDAKDNNEDIVVEMSMKKLNEANAAFKNKKFERAEVLYRQAIEIDADNMEAYSSLALTYKKLGDKNKSIEYYEKSLQAVKDGNARMNANKSLLLDREIKAASYYNAGLVREEMGKIFEAEKKYSKAKENFDMAIRNFDTAIENVEMSDQSYEKINVYKAAKERNKINADRVKKYSKVTSFNNATNAVKNQNPKWINVNTGALVNQGNNGKA